MVTRCCRTHSPVSVETAALVMSGASTQTDLTTVGVALQALVLQCPSRKLGLRVSHLLCRRWVLVKELCDQVKEIHKEISRLHSILTRKK